MAKADKNAPNMNDGADDEAPSTILEYSVNIEDQERPPVLPLGEYRATVTGVDQKFGKESGRPYLNIKLTVTPDNQPADFVEALGTQAPVSVFYMLFGCEDTPQSRFNMQNFCKAVGAPMSNRIDVREFLNLECRVAIEHQKDLEGNDQPRVRRVLSA